MVIFKIVHGLQSSQKNLCEEKKDIVEEIMLRQLVYWLVITAAKRVRIEKPSHSNSIMVILKIVHGLQSEQEKLREEKRDIAEEIILRQLVSFLVIPAVTLARMKEHFHSSSFGEKTGFVDAIG
jgi:hypothetical protein